tara:strand:+ start:1056 stop:1532 length:477 start_codon:yes stop_codon:yes gene_type:complete
MNKFLFKTLIIVFIFTLQSCSYEPIFSGKNYKIAILDIKFEGDKKINRVIQNYLNLIKNYDDKNVRKFSLIIKSEKQKVTTSRDSSGDPLKFEIIVTTSLNVIENNNLILNRKIKRNNIYNNSSDKFELEQSEKIIIENITENISNTIIGILINLDAN